MGATLYEAILEKYLDDGTNEAASISMILPPKCRNQLPSILVLNQRDIGTTGDVHQLLQVQQNCGFVNELDVAQNSIKNPNEVVNILSAFPKLSFLNISSNNMSDTTVQDMDIDNSYNKMKGLVLNDTRLQWENIISLLENMPGLEELYLSLNGYSEVPNIDTVFTNLKLLHISGNPIHKWKEIHSLGHMFPNLEILYMADCALDQLGPEDSLVETFDKLHSLALTNNMIDHWTEVEKLKSLPALQDVRLLGLPLFQEYSEEERRQLLIGRLPNVERLNGSRISNEERENAERAFIRYYARGGDKPCRYPELVQKHGYLNPLAEVNLKPRNKINMNIKFGDELCTKTIDVTQTVAAFKMSLKDLVGVTPCKMRVFYVDKEMDGLDDFWAPEELRYNNRKLYAYQMKDGDEILVDVKS